MNDFVIKKKYILIIVYIFLLNDDNNSKNIVNYIYKDLNYNKKIKNIINLKKLVYTIILGNYDKPNPFIKQEGYDYYLITDDIYLKACSFSTNKVILLKNIKKQIGLL